MTSLSPLMFMSCFFSTTPFSFGTYWRNVQFNGAKEWLCVLAVVQIHMGSHVWSNYQPLCWSTERQTSSNKHYCMKWSMPIFSLLTQEHARQKEDMARSLKRLWIISTLLLDSMLQSFTISMMRSTCTGSIYGDVMVSAGNVHLFLVMWEGRWIGSLNLLIDGSMIIRKLVEEPFSNKVSLKKFKNGEVRVQAKPAKKSVAGEPEKL